MEANRRDGIPVGVDSERIDTEEGQDLPALEDREDREDQADQADDDLFVDEMVVVAVEVRKLDVEDAIVEQAVEVGEMVVEEEGVAGVEDVCLELEALTYLLEERLGLFLND